MFLHGKDTNLAILGVLGKISFTDAVFRRAFSFDEFDLHSNGELNPEFKSGPNINVGVEREVIRSDVSCDI